MTENPKHITAFSLDYFFLFAALAVISPFFPLLLQEKGFTPSHIGFLLGSYELASITGLMVLGHFFDRLQSPRRTIVTIGLCSSSVLFLISRITNMNILVVMTICLGFVLKSPAALVDAMYGQTMRIPKESYGKSRLAGSLGFFAAAGFIQLSGSVQGNRPVTVFAGYALCIASALLITLFLPTEQLHRKPEEKHSPFFPTLKSFPRIYWLGLSIAFLNALGMAGHYTFFSLLLKNRFHVSAVGGFWAIGPVFEIPLFFFSSFLLRKLNLKRLWIICLAAGIVRMQVYSLSNSLLPLYLVQVLHSLSFALNHLCMMTLITHSTPLASRGLAMSLYTAIGMGFGLFIGGMLGGVILKVSDYPQLYQIFSLFPFIGALINVIFLKDYKGITGSAERSLRRNLSQPRE